MDIGRHAGFIRRLAQAVLADRRTKLAVNDQPQPLGYSVKLDPEGPLSLKAEWLEMSELLCELAQQAAATGQVTRFVPRGAPLAGLIHNVDEPILLAILEDIFRTVMAAEKAGVLLVFFPQPQ